MNVIYLLIFVYVLLYLTRSPRSIKLNGLISQILDYNSYRDVYENRIWYLFKLGHVTYNLSPFKNDLFIYNDVMIQSWATCDVRLLPSAINCLFDKRAAPRRPVFCSAPSIVRSSSSVARVLSRVHLSRTMEHRGLGEQLPVKQLNASCVVKKRFRCLSALVIVRCKAVI